MRCAALSLLLLLLSFGCTVDETGYLRGEHIATTADQALADLPQDVLVVGTEGAVEQIGGRLTASVADTTRTATVVVDDATGSFVVSILASAAETIELRYELDGTDTLALPLGGTATLDAPQCPGCIASIFLPPDADGFTSIDLNSLADPTPPIVLFNRTQGIAVRADTIEPPPKVRASSGDTVCIFQSAAGGQTSAQTCDTIP